jgi:aminoglycoside/choline kinase family phosphotransferase
MQTRENALNEWLNIQLEHQPFTLTPLTGDASFRRYFRLSSGHESRIVMDAPPNQENLSAFIHVQTLLSDNQILVPTIYAASIEQGFALLDDFGDELLLNQRQTLSREKLYSEAIRTLVHMQQGPIDSLPPFNIQHMLNEMGLFKEWFLKAHLKLTLSPAEERQLDDVLIHIAERVAAQPQVFIHRDYHSRNLMVIEQENQTKLGVIDFQDAMSGPITYDLVSLLKDCYFKLPDCAYLQYVKLFYLNQPLAQLWSLETFLDEIDYCGLQRHLKVLGIFCRLYLRDHKPNYLQALPLTMDYTLTCLKRHTEFAWVSDLMENRVTPRMMETCST